MIRDFKDKTVIVTGASAGVGEAAARRFAREGAKLVLVARGARALKALAEELGAGGTEAIAVPMDVTDASACQHLCKKAEFELGAIHVLVNNAGYHERGAFEKNEAENLGKMVDVNLRAPVVLTRLVLPYMRSAGEGAVVNVASLAGCTPVPGAAAYSATKFGLRGLTLSLAEELRGSPVSVGAVSPGPIDTGFIMSDIDSVTDITFSQPMSTAEEVAEAIFEVASGGRREIKMPGVSGVLATVNYFFPVVGRVLRPVLEKRGRRVKEHYKKRAAERG